MAHMPTFTPFQPSQLIGQYASPMDLESFLLEGMTWDDLFFGVNHSVFHPHSTKTPPGASAMKVSCHPHL